MNVIDLYPVVNLVVVTRYNRKSRKIAKENNILVNMKGSLRVGLERVPQ